MQRELTHAETVIETNSEGIQLCRPKYGHRWSITMPLPNGMERGIYIGSERQIRAMWDAHYNK